MGLRKDRGRTLVLSSLMFNPNLHVPRLPIARSTNMGSIKHYVPALQSFCQNHDLVLLTFDDRSVSVLLCSKCQWLNRLK